MSERIETDKRRRRFTNGEALAWRPFAIVGVTVVSVALLATLLPIAQPEPVEQQQTLEPIQSTVLLCPEPGTGGDLGVRVTAAIVPGQPGQGVGPGRAALETLPGKKKERSALTAPGEQGQIEAFGTELPAIRAFGEGSLAPGLIADQWGRDPSGRGRGLASTACAPAASEFWFVGGGAVSGRRTRVVLVNPDDTSAIVDVIVHGPDGIIDAPGGRGLVVRGKERLVLPLDVVAPGVNGTAFHVIARSGRVGASVNDEQRSGLASVGVDWIPAAADPATTVFVPGIASGSGARVLSVVSPSDSDAIVKVRIIAQDGSYEPIERNVITVPSQSVVTLDMSPALPQTPDGVLPATIELTSDQPIVAGMRQFFGGARVQDDTAFTAGSQPFVGSAAVSGLPVRAATDVRLSLTAPSTKAVVDVEILPFRGGKEVSEVSERRRISIDAGQMRSIKLEAPSDVDWFTAIVTTAPGSGPIVAAHRVREKSRFGDLITGYPWKPLRTQVLVPSAVQVPSVAAR